MSRYRLVPTPAQEAVLRGHCAHARFVWNLAVEQHAHWRPGRKGAPSYLEQCRQLTAARAEHPWLAAGSQMVQQQALRDFAQAMAAFFDPGSPAGRPSWRKAGRDEGFRIVGRRGRQWDVRRLSRKVGEVWVPKAGWVRFCWSRAVPMGVKSYRVTMDRAGRWHVAFAAIPDPIPAPGNGQAVGIDRGVVVSAALSTGELLHSHGLTACERTRLRRLERKLTRARRGSNRRRRVTLAIARLRARETDRRKDWAEKTSTDIARRFDVIRVEDLQISNMTRSARGTREHPGRNVRAKWWMSTRCPATRPPTCRARRPWSRSPRCTRTTSTGTGGGVTDCPDLAAAVAAGFRWAKPNGIVLLSPAAPSFGRFKDYRDRGEAFAREVRALT